MGSKPDFFISLNQSKMPITYHFKTIGLFYSQVYEMQAFFYITNETCIVKFQWKESLKKPLIQTSKG